ncbi:MAG: hypothetical protein JWP69_1280 [Flaviaesturariibacter sp.]|nr:hypothetical protein [Flaviaesturariibacter sp.]
MKSKKAPVVVEKDIARSSAKPLFGKENITWMIAGLVVMIIGYLLMSGGRSEDPNVFNKDEVYSTVRITIAPIVIIIGLIIEIFAIFRQPKRQID